MLKYDDRLICPIRSAASSIDKVCADKECAWFNAFLPFIGLCAPLVLLLCSKDHTQIKAPSENGKRSIEKGSVRDPSLPFYYIIISFMCQ